MATEQKEEQKEEYKCPFCGSTEIGEDGGQWFCMDCGWEIPPPKD